MVKLSKKEQTVYEALLAYRVSLFNLGDESVPSVEPGIIHYDLDMTFEETLAACKNLVKKNLVGQETRQIPRNMIFSERTEVRFYALTPCQIAMVKNGDL